MLAGVNRRGSWVVFVLGERGVLLHCHYDPDQFIKQQHTPMMRQLTATGLKKEGGKVLSHALHR